MTTASNDGSNEGSSEPGIGACPPAPYAAAPIPEQPVVETVCSGLMFSEGPVWLGAEQSLFFSDFSNNDAATNFNGAIMKYAAGAGCSVWLSDVGSNGLGTTSAGNIVACRHTDQTVTEYQLETQAPRVLADNYQGLHFSSPNDLAVRGDGNIYFSDPAWNLGTRNAELPQAVYRLDPLGNISLVQQLDGMRPNGVALSPEGARLYVAVANEIRQYDLNSQGEASNPRLFVRASSDGLAVDCAGNVYVTSNGVAIFSPAGEALGNLRAGGNVTNLAFGGPERRTLFITGGTQLRAVEMNIPGLPN